MSMLGEQIKKLREKADLLDGLEGMDNLVPMLREAADTIESLRDSLNEVADKWANAQIEAEVYARENMLLKVHNSTRWHELFGTPERAARTLASVCQFTHGGELCDRCQCYLFGDCDRMLRLRSERSIYDALLEWLRGDAE